MSRRVYSFGDFRVDPASRELRQGNRLIALPPQVFDCLTYLIQRHERAVGRDELVAAVWGKTEISDTLLGQTMLRIRRELGDDSRGLGPRDERCRGPGIEAAAKISVDEIHADRALHDAHLARPRRRSVERRPLQCLRSAGRAHQHAHVRR